jgi:hypothetical protein
VGSGSPYLVALEHEVLLCGGLASRTQEAVTLEGELEHQLKRGLPEWGFLAPVSLPSSLGAP